MSKRYLVTKKMLLYVYVKQAVEVEAETKDEAENIADDLMYMRFHEAVDPIGDIDEVDCYDTEIKEIES